MSRPHFSSIRHTITPLAWPSLLALGYFLYAHYPAFAQDYIINNDAPQHLLWLYDQVQWGEPFYTQTSGQIQSWGYYFLCVLLNLFLDPISISHWGPLISVLLTLNFSYLALKRYFPFGVALAGAFFIAHLAYPPAVGFFSRAFCVPTLAIFTWAWLSKRPWAIGGSLLFGSLFYPPALLICLGILGLQLPFLLWQWKQTGVFWGSDYQSSQPLSAQQSPNSTELAANSLPAPRKILSIIGISALLAFLVIYAKSVDINQDPWIGPFLPLETITSAAEFGPQGRVHFAHELQTPTPRMLQLSLMYNLKWGHKYWPYIIAFLLFFFAAWRSRKTNWLAYDSLLLAMILSACTLHWLAQILAPILFLPDRFLGYPGHLIAGLLLIRFVALLPVKYQKNTLFGILLMGLLLVYALQIHPIKGKSLNNYTSQAAVYEKVAALPEGSLIAAPPWIADMIPIYSQRAVLISNESAHALYFEHYHRFIDARWKAFINAYSARPVDKLEMLNFIKKYRVDYLLIDRPRMEIREFLAFQPYSQHYWDATAGHEAKDHLLLNLPDHLYEKINNRYYLIDTKPLAKWLVE